MTSSTKPTPRTRRATRSRTAANDTSATASLPVSPPIDPSLATTAATTPVHTGELAAAESQAPRSTDKPRDCSARQREREQHVLRHATATDAASKKTARTRTGFHIHDPLLRDWTGEFVAWPDTVEWFSARASGFAASDAATAAGLCRWDTPLGLFARKRGLVGERTPRDSLRLARRLVPVIRAEFEEATGEEIIAAPCPMYRHRQHPYLLATPDGMLADRSALLCKTGGFWMADDFGANGSSDVPIEWLCQAQYTMSVLGCQECHLAVLLDGRTLRFFRIQARDKLQTLLAAAAEDLWRRITTGDAPPVEYAHPETYPLLRELHREVAAGETVELSTELAEVWDRQHDLSRQCARLEAERKELQCRLLQAIGSASRARFPDGARELVRRPIAEANISYTRAAHIRLYERRCAKSDGEPADATASPLANGKEPAPSGTTRATNPIPTDLVVRGCVADADKVAVTESALLQRMPGLPAVLSRCHSLGELNEVAERLASHCQTEAEVRDLQQRCDTRFAELQAWRELIEKT